MTDLFHLIQRLVREHRVELTPHAFDQMLERNINIEETIMGLMNATLLIDYSANRGEQRILVVQKDTNGRDLHVVWDAPVPPETDAVLVTAFYPDR